MDGTDLEGKLLGLARELRPADRPLASVIDVADGLGVAICIQLHTGTKPTFAQIDLLDRPPKIIIYRGARVNGERRITKGDDNLLTSRERFSVAHELGHWVAYRHLGIRPQADRRQYWDHERVMNAFAGCLLAPEWLVTRWLAGVPEGTPVPPFAVRHWATSECRSSEEVVTKAIARHRASVGFLKLLHTRKSNGSHVLQVLCSVSGNGLQLPKERSHIDSPELLDLLKRRESGTAWVPRIQLAKCKLADLGLSWRRGSTINSQESSWLSVAASQVTSSAATPAQLPLEPL
jgi:hypothetical protein